MRVYLTHYWRTYHLDCPCYSIAAKQPPTFEDNPFPELDFFKPYDEKGRLLLERDEGFKAQYEETLRRNGKDISEWLEGLTKDVALVCWCRGKPQKLTRCSRILIAKLIQRLRPDIEVRLEIKNPAWR